MFALKSFRRKPACPTPKVRKPRLTVDGLEDRSLMAAPVAPVAAQTGFAGIVMGDNPWLEPDYSLTAQVRTAAQGRVEFYVDGSLYDDRVYIQSFNPTTRQLTVRLEQWFDGGLISSNSYALTTTGALAPYPIHVITKSGNDFVSNTSAGAMWVEAGLGNDTIEGGAGNDYIDSGAGFDFVHALAGNDIVTARAGDDTVWGGAGNDTIYGDEDHDSLRGDDGNDTIVGGLGNDSMSGMGGADKLYGMAGDDYGLGDDPGDMVADFLSGGEGNDVMDGGAGPDTINGDWGNDTLKGGLGNDVIHGNDGDDLVLGEGGQDRVYGDNGNDGLFGGANDLRDTLWGGVGFDRMLTAATRTTGFNVTYEDLIADGVNGYDVIPTFVHGYPITRNGDAYTPATWTDADILKVDEVLALLHRQANGKVTLLARPIGGNYVFVRHGGTERGFNDSWIHMTNANNQFGGTANQLRGYLLHEIGHYWQGTGFKAKGIDYWNRFKAISDWRSVDPNDPANYTLSTNEGDGNRWYLTNSGFVSDYAKTNENEDFAESFATFFMARGRWTWPYGAGSGAATAKMILFIDWAGKLAYG